MSHTPGPWMLHRDTDIGKYRKYDYMRIDTPDGKTLMCGMPHEQWCPDNDADWRLIAAAPDMLAVLKTISRGLCCVCNFVGSCDCAGDIVRAVIAKAEGREP